MDKYTRLEDLRPDARFVIDGGTTPFEILRIDPIDDGWAYVTPLGGRWDGNRWVKVSRLTEYTPLIL